MQSGCTEEGPVTRKKTVVKKKKKKARVALPLSLIQEHELPATL